MEKKFAAFEEDFRKKMETLRAALDGNDDVALLMRWIMTSDMNPFSYLPSAWAQLTHTGDGTHLLLCEIHHALMDDGDITFLVVNNAPCISFRDKHEAIQYYDADYETCSYSKLRTAEVMERDVPAFVARLQADHIKDLSRIFTADICLFGLEVAAERNCGTSDFDKVDVEACVAAAQKRNFHWE